MHIPFAMIPLIISALIGAMLWLLLIPRSQTSSRRRVLLIIIGGLLLMLLPGIVVFRTSFLAAGRYEYYHDMSRGTAWDLDPHIDQFAYLHKNEIVNEMVLRSLFSNTNCHSSDLQICEWATTIINEPMPREAVLIWGVADSLIYLCICLPPVLIILLVPLAVLIHRKFTKPVSASPVSTITEAY